MHASLPSFDRRGLRGSSLLLAGAILLGACDNDRPLEPTAAATPTTANLARAGGGGGAALPASGGLMISLLDQNSVNVTTPGGQLTATRSGYKSLTAIDNGPGDTNAFIGVIVLLDIQPGPYTVCPQVAPPDYVLLTSTQCQTIDVPPGSNVPGEASHVAFTFLTAPRVKWMVRDPVNWDAPGGALFKADTGTGSFAILDNSPLDLDPAKGKFELKTKASSVTVCPSAPPPGYAFAQPAQGCFTGATAPGQTTDLGIYNVFPEASAYWDARVDDVFVLGSSYSITGPGGFTMTVVNDGLNDMFNPGMPLYVKLPAPGWYTICQTVPPKGAQLADPRCKRVDVPFGHAQYAGMFDSKSL